VQVVGELYVVMEPFSNYRLEEELARNGVEVHRHLDLTTLIRDSITYRSHVKKMQRHAAPYVTYHLGAEGTESVARTLDALRGGFDGAVHLKPFGCMPEVNAMTAMQRISREHTFPILFVSCDAQAAEAGLRTRVEAFVDMLRAREAGFINA
jgi:predicted nucleotide-binding protein (sugar kinase/HSP70/actin superfamily)